MKNLYTLLLFSFLHNLSFLKAMEKEKAYIYNLFEKFKPTKEDLKFSYNQLPSEFITTIITPQIMKFMQKHLDPKKIITSININTNVLHEEAEKIEILNKKYNFLFLGYCKNGIKSVLSYENTKTPLIINIYEVLIANFDKNKIDSIFSADKIKKINQNFFICVKEKKQKNLMSQKYFSLKLINKNQIQEEQIDRDLHIEFFGNLLSNENQFNCKNKKELLCFLEMSHK